MNLSYSQTAPSSVKLWTLTFSSQERQASIQAYQHKPLCNCHSLGLDLLFHGNFLSKTDKMLLMYTSVEKKSGRMVPICHLFFFYPLTAGPGNNCPVTHGLRADIFSHGFLIHLTCLAAPERKQNACLVVITRVKSPYFVRKITVFWKRARENCHPVYSVGLMHFVPKGALEHTRNISYEWALWTHKSVGGSDNR